MVARRQNVVDVSKMDFKQVLTSTTPLFIMFYSPGCIHCVRAKPVLAELAHMLTGTPIAVLAVDCAQRPDVASMCGISSYPTLRLYRNGKYQTYTGPREIRAMVQWLCAGGQELFI